MNAQRRRIRPKRPKQPTRAELARQRRMLLATVAGNIAAGLVNNDVYRGSTSQTVDGRVHTQYFVKRAQVAFDAAEMAETILHNAGL